MTWRSLAPGARPWLPPGTRPGTRELLTLTPSSHCVHLHHYQEVGIYLSPKNMALSHASQTTSLLLRQPTSLSTNLSHTNGNMLTIDVPRLKVIPSNYHDRYKKYRLPPTPSPNLKTPPILPSPPIPPPSHPQSPIPPPRPPLPPTTTTTTTNSTNKPTLTTIRSTTAQASNRNRCSYRRIYLNHSALVHFIATTD